MPAGAGGFCPAHGAQRVEVRRVRDRYYDRHQRNPEAKRFYNSAAWQRAREAKLAELPVCQRCLKEWARHVHHIVPLDECTIEQRTDPENLMPVCPPCHNAIEAEAEELKTP